MRNRGAKSLAYFAYYDRSAGQGIEKKVSGFLRAAGSAGWATRGIIINKPGLRSHIRLGLSILAAGDDVLLIRSTSHYLFLILPFCWLARFRSELILDVPTPHGIAFSEIRGSSVSKLSKFVKLLCLALTGPFGYWPFHRVIQYSREYKWWMFGNRRRTKLIGNGINLQDIKIRPAEPEWPSRTLRLIAVANLSFWHGYDRLIRAICLVNSRSNGSVVELSVVGRGAELQRLVGLAKDLGVSGRIHFLGALTGDELLHAYAESHVAVASLGLHRKHLFYSSELKVREYCAVGIPFIASGEDHDFPEAVPFRYVVSPTEEVEDIVTLLEKLYTLGRFPPKETIRRYAAVRLDMAAKVEAVIGKSDWE